MICRITRSTIKNGAVAGYTRKDNYRLISVDGRTYLAHRLIWLLHNGVFPSGEIDHINRNPSDNRIENLREAGRSDNELNKNLGIRNTSGLRGIIYHSKYEMWVGTFTRNGKRTYTKYFVEKRDAVVSYVEKFEAFFHSDGIILSSIESHKKWLLEN